MKDQQVKSVTLRRDGKGPLKFNGERIGDASRHYVKEDDNQESKSYEISARLFRTASGKHILGVETYNRTDECYDSRDGWVSDSLEGLLEAIRNVRKFGYLDDDLLAEVFEKTAIADQFVEQVD